MSSLKKQPLVLAADWIVLCVSMCWSICKGCWPLSFRCLSSSQRSCDIFWCWSARRLRPLTSPSAWGKPRNPCQSPTPFWAPESKHASNVGYRRWSRFGTRRKRHNWWKGVAACRARAQCQNISVALLSCTLIHTIIFHFQWVMELKMLFSFSYLTEHEL